MASDGIEFEPVTPELIEKTLKLMSQPREPAKSGDPFYEVEQLINRCMMCKRDRRDDSVPPCDACRPRPKYSDHAPEGQVFVCGACGKTSKSIYGDPHPIDDDHPMNWDESCMLNAVLCHESSLEYQHGRVVKADAVQSY
jgi:hypothetical protein